MKGCEGIPNTNTFTGQPRIDCDLRLKVQWFREWYIHPWGVSAALKSILSLRAFVSSKTTRKYSAPATQASFMGSWRNSLGEVFAIGLFWSCCSFQPKNNQGTKKPHNIYFKNQFTANFCWQIREKCDSAFSPSYLDRLSTFSDC